MTDDFNRREPPSSRWARRPLDSSQIRGEEPLRDAGVVFRDAPIQTRKGERRALTVTPSRAFVLGRPRLEMLRAGETNNLIEEAIIARVQGAPHRYDLFVFRACDHEGQPRYRIDEALPPNERSELALRLVLSNLRCWRRLLDLKVPLILHTGLGPDRQTFQQAAQRVSADPEAFAANAASGYPGGGRYDELDELDEWLLRHVLFFFGQVYRVVARQVLPDILPMLDSRRRKLERLSSR